MDTLPRRLAYLVGRRFGGSVNAAAAALGIPQRTLARLVRGETKAPKPAVIARLAKGLGVSEEWLATGRGAGPRPLPGQALRPRRAEAEWFACIAKLGRLSNADRTLLEGLPSSALITAFCLEGSPPLGTPGTRFNVGGDAPLHVQGLVDAVHRAWTDYFRAFLREHGQMVLIDRLADPRVRALLQLGAGPAALEVASGGAKAARLVLDAGE